MATDRNHLSEEEQNQQRKVLMESEPHEDDGIIETVDRAFDSGIGPIVDPDIPDDDDTQRQREANDRETRRS